MATGDDRSSDDEMWLKVDPFVQRFEEAWQKGGRILLVEETDGSQPDRDLPHDEIRQNPTRYSNCYPPATGIS